MWLQLHAVCFGTRTLCRGPCRFQVRCDPFPARPPVPHDVKAVEQAVPLTVFAKAGHRRPHGREFRRKPPASHQPSHFAGPESGQRLVISAVLGIRRPHARVVMPDSLPHDRKRLRYRVLKREIRRHPHVRSMRPCALRQNPELPGRHEFFQCRFALQERMFCPEIGAGFLVSQCATIRFHSIPSPSFPAIMNRRMTTVNTVV